MKFNDKNVRAKMVRALEKAGLIIEAKAKELCPVDTGNLRASISSQVNSEVMSAVVGTNVPYAPYVEYMHPLEEPKPGRETGQMPFLRPAIFQSMEKVKEMIKDEFQA